MVRLRRIFFLVAQLLLGAILLGQEETRFLYFQSEPAQPFQVVQAGRTRVASISGYLILSDLPKAEVEFVLLLDGQSRYRIDLKEADRGVSIRQSDGNWRLWDLSSKQWIDPLVRSGRAGEEMDSLGASPFAQLLSRAAKDPSLLSNRRTGFNKPNAVPVPTPGRQKGKAVERADAQGIRVAAKDSLTVVWQADYFVPEGELIDTVRISIWSGSTSDAVSGGPTPVTCAPVLEEPAFMQLRTRMAAAADEDEMVLLVRRVVRTHCLSISQARRLSNLFLHDETRYRFFEALLGHVADSMEYHTLGSFLTDPVYQKRFRSLLER